MTEITIKNVSTGNFVVLKDGQETGITIVNGSAGVSGRGRNEYGIAFNGKVTIIGSLAKAKKTAVLWARKA